VLGRKPGTDVFRPLSPEHPGDETFPGLLIDAEERLRARGIRLWVVRLNPEARQMAERSPLWATLGPERLFLNMEAAVQHYCAAPNRQPASP
jgi:hypothetical protein